jgi:putative ATP-dependent endonuclease of the OLD family
MYLERIGVQNYRSISVVVVSPCRDFNVLIGRNNSGKSNILTSIEAFFAAATSKVVNLTSALGNEIDFFQKDFSRPICIEAAFRISANEREKLLSDISEESPQARNLLEGIGSDICILIAVAITPPPKRYSYVQRISLVSESQVEPRLLFEVDQKASLALYENARAIEHADTSREALDRFLRLFDLDDFSNVRRQEGGIGFDYFFRRTGVEVDPGLVAQARKIFGSSDSYETFVSSIRQLSKTMDSEKSSLSSKPISSTIRTFSGEEATVPTYVKNFLNHVNSTKILHFKERRVPIGSEEAKRLLSLKVRRGGPDVLVRIQETVNELLGVKVDAFEGPAARRGESSAELDVDDFLIQANGSGIREALRIILDTEFEKPQILLVEEPEIHLHPALETSVMSYLRGVSQHGVQVFLTTHSTNFIDTGNFQNVFLVSKESSTTIVPLSLAEAEEKLPSELGIRLSSLFMYDQIVFVEGPSDEQIIRELARILDINLGQLNVGFIQMRGVRNIGHYAAAEVVTFLTRRRVKLWFLVDSDEAESVHFVRLKEDFGASAQIHVLKRREIENYLLSARPNIAHITARKHSANQKSFVSPSPEEFAAKLNECADGLKNLAMWKRVMAGTRRPFYPNDKDKSIPTTLEMMKVRSKEALTTVQEAIASALEQIDDTCDAAAEALEQKWKAQKLDIVPGADLLDTIYR